MKRMFVIISNILVSLFLAWVFTIWSDTYVSYYYPNVAVFDAGQEVSYEKVSEGLHQLAEETDSLIAMQHQELGKHGETVFSYTAFGQGSLPEALVEKQSDPDKNGGVETNYFIFEGSLTSERLKETLSHLGMTNLQVVKPSGLALLGSLLSNGFQITVLLMFFLTFASLTLIGQIRALRLSGIRLISGEKRWKIFLIPLVWDACTALLGMTLGFVFSLLLNVFLGLPTISYLLIGLGLLVYNLLLLLIAFFFALIFWMGIKKVQLMQVIKGQVPVKGILSLILIGQFLAILMVSIAVSRTHTYSQAWALQKKGQAIWQSEKDVMTLTLGRESSQIASGPASDAKDQIWFDVIKQAIGEDKAFLSRHYLAEYLMQTNQTGAKVLTPPYSPQGNILVVTPNYLKHQNIGLDKATWEKSKQLRRGEFLLLLPETLRTEEESYRSEFEESMTNLMSSGEEHQKMSALVSYVETGQSRFLYNSNPLVYQHFLEDPILLVLTPESTGDLGRTFWLNALGSYLYFEQLNQTRELLTEHGIDHWVSEIKSGYQAYQTLLSHLKREFWMMIAAAVLGIATSLLMFNTMNLLYFAEFRRDILVKKIAGLHFLESHRYYLLAQMLVFLLGFIASVLLATGVALAFGVLLVFTFNALLLLYFQTKREEKMSMLILKGA